MTQPDVLKLFELVQSGALSPQEAAAQCPQATTIATSDAAVDVDRARRCGFPEVVYGRGKTPEAIVAIFRTLQAQGQHGLATLVDSEQAALLLSEFPEARYNPLARTVRWMLDEAPPVGRVTVISAGTSDRPIAEEALETLLWMQCATDFVQDVGVAGPHRLIEQRSRFADADAVVVVAGMEGALPSIAGGHVACPVIGVPTSVGYGANFGGVSALLSMLNSCASNVTVVNIDSGFKGGYVAGLIARRAQGAQAQT